VKKGEKESVRVEVSEGRIEEVMTEVGGSTLKIHMRSGSSKVRNPKVYVTYVRVEKLVASSGSNIFSEGTVNATELLIQASSGASIELDVQAKSIVADANSAGEVDLKGKATSLEATAESGANVNAYDLAANAVVVEANSAGEIKVSVSESLVANASSAGSIRYRGNPGKSVTNSSSGGSVKKTN
jgi:hypothetical protein